VRLWRQIYQGGRAVRRELIWVDHYEPITGLVQLGPELPASPAAEPTDSPGGSGPGGRDSEDAGWMRGPP